MTRFSGNLKALGKISETLGNFPLKQLKKAVKNCQLGTSSELVSIQIVCI